VSADCIALALFVFLKSCSIVAATAAHVLKRHEPERLQIVGEEAASNIRKAPISKEVLGGDSDTELDVGFIRLHPPLSIG
jgi:hypothetical protein